MGNSNPEIVIYHISDLHFGLYLQCSSRVGEWSSTSAPHDFNLLQGMEHALNFADVIDKYRDRLIIVVTGDLTTSAEPPAYEAVNNYLRDYPFISSKFRMGLRLQTVQDRFFVVPGNHDIWLYGNWFTRWKKHKNRREEYRRYFPEQLPSAYPLVVNGVSVTIFTIDTNWVKGFNPINIFNVLGRGEVGKEQIAEIQALHNSLIRRTAEDIPNGFDYAASLKIALMHHHLALPSGFPKDIQQEFLELGDSSSVLNLLCDIGVRLVLCGHQHFPYHISNLRAPNNPDHAIFLSCAGSATQMENKRNSFSVCEITRSGDGYNLRLLIYESDPKNYAFSVKSDGLFVI
jgi:3',5'-cyclic AMP phosphodiesterase CpdA